MANPALNQSPNPFRNQSPNPLPNPLHKHRVTREKTLQANVMACIPNKR